MREKVWKSVSNTNCRQAMKLISYLFCFRIQNSPVRNHRPQKGTEGFPGPNANVQCSLWGKQNGISDNHFYSSTQTNYFKINTNPKRNTKEDTK